MVLKPNKMNTRLIRQILEERKITQKELAQLAGISLTALNQNLLNNVKPRTETIERIAAALGISAGVLMAPPNGPIHIQSGNIKNIMGNHNGISEGTPGASLFYGTGEVELLKNEVTHLREMLQGKEEALKGKDETIETLKMLIEQYKKQQG